ncbi:hypothetical protein [Peribacillus sp. FSL M8-0224]|uniref:hypothetical protein n=1 Tax=Peribacillus sp. FSL M8-0224 TaxID=2921568 RepID=UPI0030FBFC87
MGRNKKAPSVLRLESVQIVYKQEFQRQWLDLCADWVEQEVRVKLREGDIDI